MTAPSLTLRSLQNEETGIDISVPCFQEEEAPLGGTSILYEIAVLTKLDLFKTRLHKNEDVVQFSVYKAYREVEDLYNKLSKKYSNAGLPKVPKFSTVDECTNEERVPILDKFMKALAKNSEICHSSIFTHFIGIDSQKLASSMTPNINLLSKTDSCKSKSSTKTDQQLDISEDLSDVFPKVKNVSKSGNKVVQPVSVRANNVDLFEEVKLVKDVKEASDVKSSKPGSLFDDFEDDNLFSSTPAPKPVSPPEKAKTPDVKPRKKEPEKKPVVEEVDDSQIIIKDRKLGDISLFEEQDLGDYITQDEEALFLVSTNANEKSKKNTLLFSNEESVSVEPDSELNEDLDDLLNLNPLPASPIPVKKPEISKLPATEVQTKEEKTPATVDPENQTKRPVPLPRKKSLGKCDTEELSAKTRPEVMPRKVFLTKPEVPTKPVSTTMQEVSKPAKPPPISTKPALPKKPKPPPKAPKPTQQKDFKDLDLVNANQPSALENQTSISSLADDLNKLDILKYIEQEQKTLESEPSLFD